MAEVLWTPSAERVEQTPLARFARAHGYDPLDYDSLWRWSVDDIDGFWQAVAAFCDLRWTTEPETTLRGRSMPGAQWFPGGELSFASHLLGTENPGGTENLRASKDDEPAIIAVDEQGKTETVTRRDLRARVARLQAALRERGVGPGDRVAALMPNRVETVVALLATDSLGGVFSSCSPDFGSGGVVDRFGQIEPKVLLAADGYRYNGSVWPLNDKLRAIVGQIEGLERVVVVDVIGQAIELDGVPVEPWAALQAGDAADPDLRGRSFSDPLAILYSSGTTGRPKSIVHSAGGTLIKHLCEHRLQSDVRAGDVVFWFTTCGWMMWNWLVSALASDATIVLYDGSPAHPDLSTLWRMAERSEVTHFGTSPKFLAACESAGLVPGREVDLSGVRAVLSTGSPLSPHQFDWVYENVSADVQLASISGGTDLIGCFAAGVPTIPVRRGELQGRALGMAVEAWDDQGQPVIDRKGELVCTQPFPSMPIGFWNDEDGHRYREAYFTQHPDVWTHGDLIEIRSSGGVVIYGRSDTTLNPGGVRIGTAELYRAIEGLSEITDAVVVGRPVAGDVEIVLFVVLRDGAVLDDALEQRIRNCIRSETTPRHVPRHIIEVTQVPYTISGKKVEKAVLSTLLGEAVHNRDALSNPEALDEYARVTFP